MSDERWIKVTKDVLWRNEQAVQFLLGEAFDAAEGQRVENIRWCTTHGCEVDRNRDLTDCYVGRVEREEADCVIVEGTLILPPETTHE